MTGPADSIFPAPRDLRYLPGGGALPSTADIPVERAPSAHPGKYSIQFDGQRLSARAADQDGEWSARSVLRQLDGSRSMECQAFTLRDWPRFTTRGLMLDVSRNRIPTMDTFRELVDILSKLRLNHLQLYVEHTFAYEGHEAIWKDVSPLTPLEIREIDRLCSDRGITLAANQNCFGHLSDWLRHPAYAHLAETHGPYDFYGLTRNGPFSLCPVDSRSLALVEDWISQLRECYSSSLINIGCDETADIGTGRSAEAVAQRGRASVYADFVSSVARVAEEKGFQPMFWADIALASAGTLEALPPNLKPLAWGYEPDSPFAEWNRSIAEAGRTAWVCPGTSCWRTFAGRTWERQATLDASCASFDSMDGFLITAWGDVGHQQQWPITIHALADASHAAWHGRSNPDSKTSASLLMDNPAVGPWLDELGDADRELRSDRGHLAPDEQLARLRNASATFNELYPANPSLAPRGTLAQWQACDERIRELETSLPPVSAKLEDELRWTISMSRFACKVAIRRRSGGPLDGMLDELRHFERTYRDLWRVRSRPGGLSESTSHLHRLATSLGGTL